MNNFELQGVYAPITTPFDDGGNLVLDRLEQNVEMWNITPLSGLAVLGSNGEFPELTVSEKTEVLRTAREALDNDRRALAGTGCLSTRETIALTEKAADLGYDGALIITPYYYRPRMTAEVLTEHYLAVADASPIPIVLYNMPAFAGINLSVDVVERLSVHPNIIGIKDSSGNITQLAEYVRVTPPDFSVMVGSGSMFLPGLLAGARGGVMALANVLPWECCEVYDLFREGEFEKAAALQARLVSVNQALTARFSIPGLKAAMDLQGYYGGPPRAPLLPLTPVEIEELKDILRDSKFVGC